MNTLYRRLNLRLYPTKEQETLIRKTLGSCRFIYNQMLAERIDAYERLKDNKLELYKHKYKTEKNYKQEYDWLSEVPAQALQQSRNDLVSAYSNFFKSLKGVRKGQKVGYPRFKRKQGKNSFRLPQKVNINYGTRRVSLQKIGNVKFRHKSIKKWYLSATIKSATVMLTPSGKFYVSVLFEGEPDFNGVQHIPKNPNVIGLDCSMDKFYVDQYGNSPEYRRLYRKAEKRLKKLHRDYSRKANGSNNKEKARLHLARAYEKIANQRKDFIDKLSYSLVRDYDVIVVENLSLHAMKQALKLGKSVSDLGYGDFVRKLEYKALWNDKVFIRADKWFASSKTCSTCGHINKNLLLHQREWECPKCGKHNERDMNAGENLVNYAIKELGLGRPEVTPVEKKTAALDNSRDVSYALSKQESNKLCW